MMTRHPRATCLVALVTLLLFSGAVAQESEPAAEGGYRDDRAPPSLGLSSGMELGLPGVRYDLPFLGVRAYAPRASWRSTWRPYGRYWGYRSDWVPWEPIPQTIRYKVSTPAYYRTPRLGLQYIYPYPNDIGLELPPEREEPVVPAMVDTGGAVHSPAIVEAVLLMQEGRYARAGRLLAGELKEPPAPLDVYVLIAEVLVATGKYSAAARIFSHGLEEAPSLAALDGIDIRAHFPSREAFAEKLTALGSAAGEPGAGAELKLLHAGMRLLSGDRGAMTDLETLQRGGGPVAEGAKRLYLHFVDTLFEEEESAE